MMLVTALQKPQQLKPFAEVSALRFFGIYYSSARCCYVLQRSNPAMPQWGREALWVALLLTPLRAVLKVLFTAVLKMLFTAVALAAALSHLFVVSELTPLVPDAHVNFYTIGQTAFFTQVTSDRLAIFLQENPACLKVRCQKWQSKMATKKWPLLRDCKTVLSCFCGWLIRRRAASLQKAKKCN